MCKRDLIEQGGGGGHDYFYNPDGSLAWVDYNDPDNHTHQSEYYCRGINSVW